ncbi:MAG TPA: FG-GAP-like repeat-containing protein [Pyrinomonadaceae bacterium]|jgi:hypothetical protein|nr:FG-GAP-like repeat-containing protein [Pyrinomonadaceae bacterium]
MKFRTTRALRTLLFIPVVISALFFLNSTALSQKVRLRGYINPDCVHNGTGNSRWKFADIYADGNIAVQGSAGCRGVFIYDITDPSHPVLAKSYQTADNDAFFEAIVIGNRGYFGSTLNKGVHIVDLTDPYNPVLLGVADETHGNAFKRVHEMVVWGNYLIENYNGVPNRTIKFINISNPANPVFVREIVDPNPGWAHAMHVRGSRMFVSDLGGGAVGNKGATKIYDISNIETQQPVLIGNVQDAMGNLSDESWMHSSWTSEDGNYIYSCREDVEYPGKWEGGDVRVYDIHDPAQPLLVNRITGASLGLNASTPHNPVVKGNRLYVSWYEAGLQIFDISDPAHPVRIGQYDTFPETYALTGGTDRQSQRSAKFDPFEYVCGFNLNLAGRVVTSGYDGDWAVYPFLGDDKILAGYMDNGLFILDTTRIAAPLSNQVSDFDGDRKTDLSKYSPATGVWQIVNSSNGGGNSAAFGLAGDKLVAGDYDGDGKSDIAVWRPGNGVWYSLNSSDGIFRFNAFGLTGDIPVPGDYDADGRTDIAVWRPSNGVWYIFQSTLGISIISWGLSGDRPLVGDYEGDGKADPTIYRDGSWYVLQSSSSLPIGMSFGLATDKPLAGDFDGDGRSDFAVFRPSTGVWYVWKSSINNFTATGWGLATDLPVSADYDADGKTDLAVYRPGDGNWHILGSTAGYSVANFGTAADIRHRLRSIHKVLLRAQVFSFCQ